MLKTLRAASARRLGRRMTGLPTPLRQKAVHGLRLIACMLLTTAAWGQSGTTGSGGSAGSSDAATKKAPLPSSATSQISQKRSVKHAIHSSTQHRAHSLNGRVDPPAGPAPLPRVIPPAEQVPEPATIAYKAGDLSVDAKNSSLREILSQISAKTGLRVEGLGQDERIYGQYGPGPLSMTLADLLDGSGYNFVIIGSTAGPTGVSLALTPRTSAPNQPATATPPSVATADQQAPPPASAGGAEGPPSVEPEGAEDPDRPKTPQEIFDELRRTQQQQQPQ